MEAKGDRAHYIDGTSEPYNRGARHAPVLPMRVPELRDSGTLSPDFWLVLSLRLGVGDGRRSDSEARAAGAGGSSGATEPCPNGSPPRECVVHKPERARAEQREQQGRRGASRHGAQRVLVPADLNSLTSVRSELKNRHVRSAPESLPSAPSNQGGHSAQVKMRLLVNGGSIPGEQLGPDFLIFFW